MNDWELIQKYCSGSESAFEALVKQHVDYVYCAALRQVRDPALAEDVSQAVFLLLAQKAKTFRPDTILVSWLFRTTQNIASHAVRSELRRQRRESEAATMNPTTSESDAQWERVSPMLDEALATLPNKDRDAILLRFISRKPFSEVGAQIGASEDAAKKRVSRALGRLREFFLRRGSTLTVAAIGVMLGERVVHAAPVALSTKITAGVLSGASATASTSAATLLQATLRDFFWKKIKWGAALGAGVVAVLSLGTAAMRHGSDQRLATAPATLTVANPAATEAKTASPAEPVITTNSVAHTLSLLILRSEDHQPISGARILVNRWTDRDMDRLLDTHTDASGTLNIDVPDPSAFIALTIWVSADNHVPMVMTWQNHEFNEPALFHTVALDPGRVVAGTVLDEFGTPIPGAKVSFTGPGSDTGKRDNYAFHPELSGVLTDVNGHWATTQYPANRDVGVRADASAYVSVETWAGNLTGFPTNVLMHMSNGVALVGRVTSTNGTPIAKARVTKQNGSAYVVVHTDADGVFRLPHIERGQTLIDVAADGFKDIQSGIAWATNDVNECTFTMTTVAKPQSTSANQPQVALKGTVTDAETGKPIPSFRILQGTESLTRSDASLANGRLIGEGREGHFEWQMPGGGGFRLQAEADGYLAAISDQRNNENAGEPFTFKLRRSTTLIGHVLTPDGLPAKNAVVSLTGANIGPSMQSPGELLAPNPGFEDSRTSTDDNGNFRLLTMTGAHGVAIIHETGTALLTYEAATNAPVTLQRWGIVEGILYLNGQPAPNQTVYLGGTEKSEADPKIAFYFGYMATTDANGKFHFEKALPGKHRLEREVSCPQGSSGPAIINPDQTADVEVKPGTVATVDLRRDGRPVIGRLIARGATNDIDWGLSQGLLESTNKYPFALSKDGTMRAEDVPPGTYKLSISLAMTTAQPIPFRNTFGTLEKQVIVPPSENQSKPVDLGTMTITQSK